MAVHLFTQQFAVMLLAGIPVARAMETLARAQTDPRFGRVVEQLLTRVSEGVSLSRAVAEFPGIFSPVYQAMIRLGESTGALLESMQKLSEWQERDGNTWRKVASAMSYPMVVVGLSLVLTLVLFNSVLPSFISTFQGEAQLPMVTRALMLVTRALSHPGGWLALLGGLAVVIFLLQDAWSDPPRRRFLYGLLTEVPILGPLLSAASVSRMAAALAAMVSVGVSLPTGLKLAARVSGSPLLEHDADRLVEGIKAGRNLSELMAERRDLYPGTFLALILSGEESGHLSEALERVARFFEGEMEYRLESLGAILGPLVLGFVAILVGSILVSVLMPLYNSLSRLL